MENQKIEFEPVYKLTPQLWVKGVLSVHMWHCGDECDCTEPTVEVRLPNNEMGYPWVNIKVLEKGTFHSDADYDEFAKQIQELQKLGVKYNCPVGEGLCTNRELTTEEKNKYWEDYHGNAEKT